MPELDPALITVEIKDVNNRKPVHPAFVMRDGLDLNYILERQEQILASTPEVWRTVEERGVAVESEAETQTESTTQTEQPHRNEVAEIYSGF